MFNVVMLLSGGTNPIMCQSFRIMLKKLTMLWFSTLKPNSIHDFFELTACFLTHFFRSRAHRKTLASPINLRQSEHELLWTFLNRFNQEAIQIRDLNPMVSLHAIMARLRAGLFANSLAWRPPSSLDDLSVRVARYLTGETTSDNLTRTFGCTWSLKDLIIGLLRVCENPYATSDSILEDPINAPQTRRVGWCPFLYPTDF